MDFSAFVSFLDKIDVEYELYAKSADLVSFRVGGTAKIVVYPNKIENFVMILDKLRYERFVILGNGTNSYFYDGFFDGVVIITKLMNDFSLHGDIFTCSCGALVRDVCKYALDCSYGGIEFAYGIPGTIGGCVTMNASAFFGEFSQIVVTSLVYDMQSGQIMSLDHNSHSFATKSSVFRKANIVLLNTQIRLKKEDKNIIAEKMSRYIMKRQNTQPLNFPSAGSVFVKPDGFYAGDLIERCGLKGYTVGGAQISLKHAGFIVNKGNATAKDIKELITIIKMEVFNKFNVKLKEEIIYIE